MRQTFDQFPAYRDTFERLSGISKQDLGHQLEPQQTFLEILTNDGPESAYTYLENEFQRARQLKEEI